MADKKPLILAIDDTPANLLILGMALEEEFDLQIATSGASGLTLAEQSRPDLILLDIMMPEMDGFETCRRLKANPALQDIPVIFVSALTEMASESSGLALGAADYITKPVNVEIARQRIRNLIDREALRQNVIAQRDQLEARVAELARAQQVLTQTQATLAQSEAFKRTILNSLIEEIAVIDKDGVIQAVNDRWLRFPHDNLTEHGKLADRVEVGSNYLDASRKASTSEASDAHAAAEALKGIQAVLGGTLPSFSMEYPCHSPTQPRWFMMVVTPLPQSTQDGAVIAHTDITEQKQQQRRLERVLLEQKAMLENDLVGIVKTAHRTILWANPAFEKMFGYDPGELIGVSTRQVYSSDQAFAALAAVAYPVLATGDIFRSQIEVVRKNGAHIWVDLSGAMLDPATDESLWTFVDITSRRHAEAGLRQQLRFVEAHNQIAQAIIDGGDSGTILQKATAIVGHTLELDRALVYQVSIKQRLATGVCEWLNPQHPEMQPSAKTYPLDMFIGGATEILRTKRYLTSHRDDVNPIFLADGSSDVLHRQMNIQSLLWYPFGWSDETRLVLLLDQVYASRHWTASELDFLKAIVRQINMALAKIRLLEEQKKAQAKLQLAASVFTHAREGITITTLDGTIVEVNGAFTRITGYSRDEVVGKNPRILSSGRQGKEFYANLWQQLNDKGHWYGEIWNRRKNGELYAEMLTITAARDAHGDAGHYVALFSDITAYKAHEDQLEHIAHYDALTNLPNRVLLADRLRQGMAIEQRRGKKLAVVFLDLDGFKAVNDTHGHEAGDQLLITLTAHMKQTLREGDTLARIGGDEFVAVLGDLEDASASVPMLTRLLGAAAQPLTVNGAVLQVSASVGVTCYPQAQDVEADQLIRQADQAMYQAKLAGKNRFSFFDAEQDSGIRSLHQGIERIRQGLAGDEFVLYYQPKVNMRTGAVIGAEALIRWQCPGAGLLAPGQFLPTIENHPLAVELGEWVIDTAVTQMETWQAQGLNLPVSINVGARQLQHADFVRYLQKVLAAHPKVAPASLEIEILETSALEDLARVSQVIEACRALGVTFAMDDFGTGYSSLTYLRHLRVNLLKIDQSFVRDMLEDADDLAILQGVIGLAKAFGREVIAEGVETVAHGVLLLQLGCELAQGYCIARPMPAHDIAAWQRDWKPDPAWACDSSPYQGRCSPE